MGSDLNHTKILLRNGIVIFGLERIVLKQYSLKIKTNQ